jgi:hypothetical protein
MSSWIANNSKCSLKLVLLTGAKVASILHVPYYSCPEILSGVVYDICPEIL